MVLRLNPRVQDEPRGKFIPLFFMNFINEFPSDLYPFFMDSLLLGKGDYLSRGLRPT